MAQIMNRLSGLIKEDNLFATLVKKYIEEGYSEWDAIILAGKEVR